MKDILHTCVWTQMCTYLYRLIDTLELPEISEIQHLLIEERVI